MIIYAIFAKKTSMHLDQEEWWLTFSNDSNGILIDVRTSDEFERGHIPGALNLDIYKGQGFVYLLDELDKSKNYYVYCHSGGRSSQALQIMKQLDFGNVYNLLGGIMAWRGPVE